MAAEISRAKSYITLRISTRVFQKLSTVSPTASAATAADVIRARARSTTGDGHKLQYCEVSSDLIEVAKLSIASTASCLTGALALAIEEGSASTAALKTSRPDWIVPRAASRVAAGTLLDRKSVV